MASISWSSGNSGAWTVASNWSPAMVPGAGDDAFIGAFGTYVVTIPTETVNSITLNDPAATLSSGSALTINDGLSIEAGTLDIATGAVEVLGAFTNAGTVVDTGSLALFGGYGVADIERIGGSGGSLSLAGSLDNTGGILDGSGLSQIRILTLGTIHGGTVTGIQQPVAATLDGVTWQGLLDAGNFQVSVLNSLDVTGANGSGPGTITMEGGSLAFTGSPTLSNAIISGSGAIFVNDTLTLSTSLQINLANQGSITFLPTDLPAGDVSNAGTINLIGRSIFPEDNGVFANIEIPQFDNSGTLETSGSGGLNGDATLLINAGTFTNEPGALLGAFAGRITIAGTTALTNNGTIAASAGSIDVGTLLQGAGQVDASNGAKIEFAGAVASTQTINMSGAATLTLDQPAIFFGTIESFAPGDMIALGVSATPISYSAGDLKLSAAGNQTLDLHIPGPFSLANFVAVAQAGTTTIHVNGSSAAAPILQGAGQTVTYVSLGTAVAVDPGLTISDTESATLIGATISISNGSFPGDGDLLSANTTGTAIIASFNGTTEVLTLSGKDTLADYLRVLHSVSFDSGVADPTRATSQPSRTVTWVINDGTATSAPVTSTVAIQPTARLLLWTGASDRSIANAANWNDTTSVLNPANLAPDAADSASFLSGGGTIAGTGTFGSLVFGGSNNWLLGSGAVLNAASGIDDGGAVTLASGATILSQGEFDSVSSASSGSASLTVSGNNSVWTSIGTLIIGEQAASGTLTIQNNGALIAGGLVVAQQGGSGAVTVTGAGSLHVSSGAFVIGSGGLGSLLIAAGGQVTTSGGDASIASAGADGSSASVDGPGSTWQIAGALQIGNAAAGMLSVTSGGTVTAAALDAGVQNVGTQDGAGQVNLVGPGSEVMVTGNATIGDAAAGAMSILSRATFAATGLTIGGATGNGVVTVSGAGSRLNLSGTLNVGTTLGVGELTIGPSATVVAATAVLHGQVVSEGGLLDATQIDVTSGVALVGYGAFGAAGGLIVNSGTIDADGGTIVASGTATGTGEWLVSNGSTLDLTGAVDSTQSVVFATASGALVVGDIAGFQGVVTQFTLGGEIIVDTFSAATFSRTGSAVSVIAGGTTLGVVDFASAALAATAMGGGLVDQLVPCFAAGTRISTERGEVPVEELKVGDLVQVIGTPSPQPPSRWPWSASRPKPARGGGGLAAQPIIWLGQRTVDCVRHPQPHKVWPVRIRSGAFGPGRPCDDLWLSPDHAVFVGDVLIPVKYLINGVTIAQVPVQEVTYYHVELPHHAVLLADGLPAESYLDTGDRTNFENGGGPVTLYPDFSSHVWDAEGCAVLVVTGPELDSARHWVNALAHDLYGRNGAARYRAAG